jgi:hypothetical protein
MDGHDFTPENAQISKKAVQAIDYETESTVTQILSAQVLIEIQYNDSMWVLQTIWEAELSDFPNFCAAGAGCSRFWLTQERRTMRLMPKSYAFTHLMNGMTRGSKDTSFVLYSKHL